MNRTSLARFVSSTFLTLALALSTASRADFFSPELGDGLVPDAPTAGDEPPVELPDVDAEPSDAPPAEDPVADVVDMLADPSQADDLLDVPSLDDEPADMGDANADDFDTSLGDSMFLMDGDGYDAWSSPAVPTPEPGSLAVWTLAAVGAVGYRWRKRKLRAA